MKNSSYDLIIVGAGLAGLMSLIVFKKKFPWLKILVLEKKSNLSQDHTWCFHESDVPTGAWEWLKPYVSKTWSQYEVRFPKYSRTLKSPYHAIVSRDFAEKVLRDFKTEIRFDADVIGVKVDSVTLANEEALQAKVVLQAQGWPALDTAKVAFQKFVGLDVELSAPHGLSGPILKDATLPQSDGYRFVYTLPWSETRCLIEDTYYSNHADLSVDELKKGIEIYARLQGWNILRVERVEIGCLPLALYELPDAEGTAIGAQSLTFNPVTGYTMPQTLALAESFFAMKEFSEAAVVEVLERWKQGLSQQGKYLRLLNRMMFLVAKPEHRYKILERFYSLNEGLIHRFYGTRLTFFDKLRILSGKPPVNPLKALGVLVDRSK